MTRHEIFSDTGTHFAVYLLTVDMALASRPRKGDLSVFKVEIQQSISGSVRRDVDRLIFDVWTAESRESGDVDLLVSLGTSVLDQLDSLSTHVLVRNTENKLVGYGRVAIATDLAELRAATRDADIAGPLFPLGYISRLVVDPAFRGQGIASLIHTTRIEIARKSGAMTIYGWAVGDKPRAALARAGFSEGTSLCGFTTTWYTTVRKTRLVKLDLFPAELGGVDSKKDLPPRRREAL